MGFLTGGTSYVVAALVFVLALGASAYGGWHQRDRLAVSEAARIQAEAKEAIAQAKQENAEVSAKVVTVFKDRIVKIREVGPEVKQDVQVLRASECRVPASFLRLHNDATGSQDAPAIGADDSASCADAVEAIRNNYLNARADQEQLKALQAWAEGVSGPSDASVPGK